MKLFADENIALFVVQKLRQQGFDVKDIKEENLKGIADRVLIEIANKENRIVITHDKNFGHVLTQPNIKHKGVLIVRCKNQHYLNVADVLSRFLNSNLSNKCKNNVVTISEDQITVHKN